MKKLKHLFLALAGIAFVATAASAQTGVSYEKTGTKNIRLSGGVTAVPMNVPNVYVSVWNTTDSTITDGSVVVVDTTSIIKRIGVRNYLPASQNHTRVLGLAYGNIPKSSTGQPGRVMITGYHPNALIGASGVTAFQTLKYSLSINGSLAAADTVSSICGIVLGGNPGSITGVRYTYQVLILRPMALGGATL